MQSPPERFAKHVQKQLELQQTHAGDNIAPAIGPLDVVTGGEEAAPVLVPASPQEATAGQTAPHARTSTKDWNELLAPSDEVTPDQFATNIPSCIAASLEQQAGVIETSDNSSDGSVSTLSSEQHVEARRLGLSEAEYAYRLDWDRQNLPDGPHSILTFEELHKCIRS